MRKRGRETVGLRRSGVLLLGFLLGASVGAWWYYERGQGTSAAFTRVLQDYLRVLKEGEGQAEFWKVLLNAARWPFLAWVFSRTKVGAGLMPWIFVARGLCLTLSVLTFIGTDSGGVLGFLLLGINALWTLPLFFLLGTQGPRSQGKTNLETPEQGRSKLRNWRGSVGVVAGAWVLAGALAEWKLVPLILRVVVGINGD